MKKVFDFNEQSLPHGILGQARELAWPCRMYRVTLPKAKHDVDSKYNAFELCFLKMLAYARFEPRELAAETCLPVDLVEIILLRLYDRGLIDENYQLLPETAERIEELSSIQEKEPTEYGTYVIFKELVSGRLLPALKEANISAEDVDDHGNIRKNEKTIRLSQLDFSNDDKNVPSISEFLAMQKIMARRRNESKDISYATPAAEFISISQESEQCRIRVRLVIQMNSDWRICNPFGKSWSRELEAVYQTVLENNKKEADAFLEWQSYNKKERSEKKQDDTKVFEPFDTLENRGRYPELINTLLRKGLDVYAALEWTLYYTLKKYDLKHIIQLLSFDTAENNQALLEEATMKLIENGVRHSFAQQYANKQDDVILKAASSFSLRNAEINQTPSNETTQGDTSHNGESSFETVKDKLSQGKRLVNVPIKGKLHSFQFEDMAEMQVVLPLAILFSQENPNFPFNNVMQAYPDTLTKIFDLKKRRDVKRHGHSRWDEIFGSDDIRFMREIIAILLPSVRFSGNMPGADSDKSEKADARLNARLVLQDVFGLSSFEKMDSFLQEYLIQAEMFRQEIKEKNDNFDVLRGINVLYAALQCFFRPLLKGNHPSEIASEAISQKVRDAGWGVLPESLRNVRQEMIQKTLAGNDQTLGASIIAWLLFTDIDILQAIAEKLPSLISSLDHFLGLNRHANQTCLMRGSDFDSLCKEIYNIIKNIREF